MQFSPVYLDEIVLQPTLVSCIGLKLTLNRNLDT